MTKIQNVKLNLKIGLKVATSWHLFFTICEILFALINIKYVFKNCIRIIQYWCGNNLFLKIIEIHSYFSLIKHRRYTTHSMAWQNIHKLKLFYYNFEEKHFPPAFSFHTICSIILILKYDIFPEYFPFSQYTKYI